MKWMRNVLIMLLFVGCLNGFSLFAQDKEESPEIKRPLEEWVFKGQLDEHPHSVVMALHVYLWVSYDTTTCQLTQSWRGGIKRNKENRERMETVGLAYYEKWSPDNEWFAMIKGKRVELKKRFMGFEEEDNKIYLNYEFTLPDGQSFVVTEYPEYTGRPNNENRSGLERTFTLQGAPEDLELFLHVECDGVLKNNDIRANSKLKNVDRIKKMYDWGTLRDIKADVWINPSIPTIFTMMFTYDLEKEARKRNG